MRSPMEKPARTPSRRTHIQRPNLSIPTKNPIANPAIAMTVRRMSESPSELTVFTNAAHTAEQEAQYKR